MVPFTNSRLGNRLKRDKIGTNLRDDREIAPSRIVVSPLRCTVLSTKP